MSDVTPGVMIFLEVAFIKNCSACLDPLSAAPKAV